MSSKRVQSNCRVTLRGNQFVQNKKKIKIKKIRIKIREKNKVRIKIREKNKKERKGSNQRIQEKYQEKIYLTFDSDF